MTTFAPTVAPSAAAIVPSGASNAAGGKQPADSVQDIARFVSDLSGMLTSAIKEINDINANTRLLALNARIEAARSLEISSRLRRARHLTKSRHDPSLRKPSMKRLTSASSL